MKRPQPNGVSALTAPVPGESSWVCDLCQRRMSTLTVTRAAHEAAPYHIARRTEQLMAFEGLVPALDVLVYLRQTVRLSTARWKVGYALSKRSSEIVCTDILYVEPRLEEVLRVLTIANLGTISTVILRRCLVDDEQATALSVLYRLWDGPRATIQSAILSMFGLAAPDPAISDQELASAQTLLEKKGT